MKLIIGLGNPGEKYRNTRHNVGFMALNEFLEANNKKQVANNKFKLHKKSNSEIAELIVSHEKIILVKPQTFMNNSGTVVKALTTTYKLQPTNLLIIHDEIDLLFGEIRASQNASSAGHKGVQSVIDSLGTQDFTRIRVGVESREDKTRPATEAFILQKFSQTEAKKLPNIMTEINKKIEEFIQN